MKNERILAHSMAKKLSIEDLKGVSAAGTTHATSIATYAPSSVDVEVDVNTD